MLDRDGGRLLLVDRNGRYLADLAAGLAGAARLVAPVRVAVGPDGTIYVLDPPAGLVRRFSRQGSSLTAHRYAETGAATDLLAVSAAGRAAVLVNAGARLLLLPGRQGGIDTLAAPSMPTSPPSDLAVAGDTLLYLASARSGAVARWRLPGADARRGDDR